MMKATSNKHFVLDVPERTDWKGRVKRVLYRCQAVLYKAKLNCCKLETPDKKYNVAICAIFKNEAPYLKEWIEFHRIVGVEHFYLYNNNSEDAYQTVLEPYIKTGLVTMNEWPYNQAQMRCYQDCISRFRSETKWLGFIDIDEFVVPKSTDTIYEFLKPFETNRGAVKIYWRLYGTSGKMERDINGLVSEDFVVCWPKYYDVGKCFYNTNFEFNEKSHKNEILHHKFWANYRGKDIPPVNVFDRVCVENINSVPSDDHPIQINHYFTKSYQEYVVKCAKGDVCFEVNPHDEEYFYYHEMQCGGTDYAAYKYLIKLKRAMGIN